MNLLMLLNGKEDVLLSVIRHHCQLKNKSYSKMNIKMNSEFNCDVIKIDEKLLVQFRQIFKIIYSKPYKNIFFGCIELGLQRFKSFMHFYILLSQIKSGGIIDESGEFDKFSTFKFLSKILPSMLIEGLISIFVVIYFYIKLFFSRWIFLKKRN